ncbi:MAG: FYDLN acid domain-containing protein [Alphaproteobacteria bacterium]|nr:FYDLN acid domain-containing protein [Alphaproteobacteria bacterium]
MSKVEWGQKRTCLHCGKLYYDMKKKPPVCPACQTPFDPESLVRRRGRNSDKKAVVKEAVGGVIEEIPIEADDDSLIEDAEELSDEGVENVVDVGNEDD